MIDFELHRDKELLVVRPAGPLEADDFRRIARAVDPWIREHGKLAGLLIDAPSFPGWDSFGALLEHLKFIRDHHRNIQRVAAVTDSDLARVLPRIVEHFARPDIRVFRGDQRSAAQQWAQTGLS